MFVLLESLEDVGPMTEYVADGEAFAGSFERAHPVTVRNAVSSLQDLGPSLADGVELQFPAGVYRLKGLMNVREGPFPRDVTVSGAGMDATLLVLRQDLNHRSRIRNLTLRDCTIHTDGNYLFDLRNEFGSMRLERVRITGFDMGAGASCVFKAPGTALYARGCRIEGGFGRSPGSGRLFDVRSDALLARFEDCWFDTVNLDSSQIRRGASVVYADCIMRNILDRSPQEAARPRNVLFPGTVIHYHDRDRGDSLARDLNDLFPDWKERIEE